MATVYKISMSDGRKESLTLNLGALAELSKKNKELADKYFYYYKKLQSQKQLNELEMGQIIYVAYACAHVKDEDPIMPLEEFLWNMTDSREEIGSVFQQLFGVQEKKLNFQKHSKRPQGN